MENKTCEKIISLFQEDHEFGESVLKMAPEEAAKAFETRGISVTVEELIAIGEGVKSAVSGGTYEINEQTLESVAGGWSKVDTFGLGAILATGTASLGYAAIVCVAAGIAFPW